MIETEEYPSPAAGALPAANGHQLASAPAPALPSAKPPNVATSPDRRWLSWPIVRQATRMARSEFGRLLLIIVGLLVVGSNLIWLFERGRDSFSANYIIGIGDALWYAVVTMSTVGYGDKTPVTLAGRLVGSGMILGSVVLVSLFTATVSSLLVARRIKEGDVLDAEALTGHTILCGWNRNMPRFLAALSASGPRLLVLINEAPTDVIEPHLKAYASLKILFVRGSFTQESILKEAAIAQAGHVVIVPDESAADDAAGDEQQTVLATLMIKELAPHVKVYAHVLHREDAAHLKRAKADEVLVSDEFTGELLANHVAHPGAPQALAELMAFDTGHAVQAVAIPGHLVGGSASQLADHLRQNGNLLLLGFAVREEGFGLNQAMQGGSDYIRDFIRQQVESAGINMSTDEHIAVRLNPAPDYVIGPNHSALVMS
ncbi:MAG: potassium channel family protein [Chloroflexota bacterium]